MIKLTLPDNLKDSGLALPQSTPKTLIEVSGENLPYACQCPCCGSLFNIPEGLLYKVEDDALLDGTFDTDGNISDETDVNIDMGGSDNAGIPTPPSGSESEPGVGDNNDTVV